jgi:hypothetical protein
MPSAIVNTFNGLKPLVDPLLLEESDATVANNVKLISGSLNPLRGSTVLKALTKTQPKTLFRYGSSTVETEHWLEFLTRTDVMRSPIQDNQYGMLYWADGVEPRYAPNALILSGGSFPGGSYKLGIPAPANTPTITGTVPAATAKSVTLTAIYTYVSAYGEEGPPSPASSVVAIDPAANITVGGMSTAPSGPYNIEFKRIYVSSTAAGATDFQFWKQVPVAQSGGTGLYEQAALGEVASSYDWVAPPAALKGLRMMANGIAVGFVENTAYASEPNLPHAWPHQFTAEYRIVGVGTFGQSAAFLTDAFPYVLSGVDPAAMTFEKLSLPQACVSIESIVETGNAVYYASPDGIVAIGSDGVDVVTKTLMSRDQWQAYNPSSIVASLFEGRYIATFQRTNGQRGVLVMDFSGQGALLTEADINSASAITAMHHDARTDTLYLAQGTNIVRFDAGSALTYRWRSKMFRFGSPINLCFGQVLADAYPVTMRVYADGQLRQTKTVSSAGVFRLLSGFRAANWQFELEGSARVTQALISTSVGEIKMV